MAAHLFDIDGTILVYHKNEWLPGAKEYINGLLDQGHQVMFWTMRGVQDEGKEWSVENTKRFLMKEGLIEHPEHGAEPSKVRVWFGVQPGRHIYDDTHCHAHNVCTNQGFTKFVTPTPTGEHDV